MRLGSVSRDIWYIFGILDLLRVLKFRKNNFFVFNSKIILRILNVRSFGENRNFINRASIKFSGTDFIPLRLIFIKCRILNTTRAWCDDHLLKQSKIKCFRINRRILENEIRPELNQISKKNIQPKDTKIFFSAYQKLNFKIIFIFFRKC